MKKIALFNCDIQGTITTWAKSRELENYYKKLEKLLEQIRIKSNADELIFSHSTGADSRDYLFEYVDQIELFFENKKIILGNQYMGKGCFDKNKNLLYRIDGLYKIKEIEKYVKNLQKDNEVVWVGFADDSIGSWDIGDLIYDLPDVPEVYGFIPDKADVTSDVASKVKQYNMDGLIESIERYLDSGIIKVAEKDDLMKTIEEDRRQIEHQEQLEEALKAEEKQKKEREEQKKIEAANYLAKKDSYTYLAENQGYQIARGVIDDENVDFLVSMYKILEEDIENGFPKQSNMTNSKIHQLKLLEGKYTIIDSKKEKNIVTSFTIQQHQIFKSSISHLLNKIFKCGYLHKYSADDINTVLNNSSILAVDMALYPNAIYKARPKNKFYRLCSVHVEGTPSLVLYDNKPGAFRCYGCGYSGTITTYINQDKNLTFIDAIETLAASFSTPLPERSKTNIDYHIVDEIQRALESDYYNELLYISEQKTIEVGGKQKTLKNPYEFFDYDDSNFPF